MTILIRLATLVFPSHAPLGLATLTFDAAAGTCSVFDGARGVQVRCLAGCLWVTQEGQYQDIELHRGGATQITCDGKTLVTTIKPARFAVHGAWRTGPGRGPALATPVTGEFLA